MSTVIANPLEKALVLRASIRAGLINGCPYYDRRNNPLITEDEILEAVRDEGCLIVGPASELLTTTDEQLAILNLEEAQQRRDPFWRHPWTGSNWIRARSIDSWDTAVRKYHPGAILHIVAGGAVWVFGRKIVAELRNRNGNEFPREGWIEGLKSMQKEGGL